VIEDWEEDRNYNRIQTARDADGDNIVGMGTMVVGMGTKYFTVSASSL